jgi:GNAT superfamily N-acetyltransferase
MVSIRALTPEDGAVLATFSCGQIGQAWSDVVEEMVQRDLPIQIASERRVSAVGLWDGDELCGVAAWKIFDATQPILCQGILVAVAHGHRGKGYGRQLMEVMKDAARVAGAEAISFVVDQRNLPMIHLSESVGGDCDEIPDDPDNLLCYIALDPKFHSLFRDFSNR